MSTQRLALIALVTLLGLSPVNASPITYDLVGVTATFGIFGTDTITGIFTFDPSTDTTNSANFEVSAPYLPGAYTLGLQLAPLNSVIQADGTIADHTAAQAVILFFDAPLMNTPDGVFQIGFGFPVDNVCCTWVYLNGTAVTGEAVPQTPLPATLPLFATALGALGLFGWRRWPLQRDRNK